MQPETWQVLNHWSNNYIARGEYKTAITLALRCATP
jgi:hypothetical protein